MRIKTIRRNQKKVEELFKKNVECTCYSLSNGFKGSEVTKELVKGQLNRFDFARLLEEEEWKRYTVDVHSNLWYTIIVHPEGY
jgi:hypothetical protein